MKTKKELLREIRRLKIELQLERLASVDALSRSSLIMYEFFNKKIKELEKVGTLPQLPRVKRVGLIAAGEYDICIDPAKLLLDGDYFPQIRRVR